MDKVNPLSFLEDLRLMASPTMTTSDNERFIAVRAALAELIDAAGKGETGDMVGWSSALIFTPAKASRLRSALAKVQP